MQNDNKELEKIIINEYLKASNTNQKVDFSKIIYADEQIRNCGMVDYVIRNGNKQVYIELVRLPQNYMHFLKELKPIKKTFAKLKNLIGDGFEFQINGKKYSPLSKKKNQLTLIKDIEKAIRDNNIYANLKMANFEKYENCGFLIIKNYPPYNKIKFTYNPNIIYSMDIDFKETLRQIKEAIVKFQNANLKFGNGENILIFLSRVRLDTLDFLQRTIFNSDYKVLVNKLKKIKIYLIELKPDMTFSFNQLHPEVIEGVFRAKKYIDHYRELLSDYFPSSLYVEEV